MRKTRLSMLCCGLLLAWIVPAMAQDDVERPPVPITWMPLQKDVGFVGQILQHPEAGCNPAWIGHAPGTFNKAHEGSTWRFDQDVAGTDSSQGWVRWELPYRMGAFRSAVNRPEWALDYGNSVNNGNTQLENARLLTGRKYIMRGVAGVWHRDTMVGVKSNLSNGGEPSSTPLAGVSSAWCGLREAGNTTAIDALTGNALNGDLQQEEFGIGRRPEFPGYGNLWDQMLYKDFPSPGNGTINFRVRLDMSNFVDPVTNGSGWFNPDPTSIANFVNNPADTFMVYAGSPNETCYDTNRRWFSEVLDLSKPVKELYARSGQQSDITVALSYSGIVPVGGNIRVVFRVKTNRVRSDETTNIATGYNSKDGAAIVDDVQVNGGLVYGFETASSITARSLILNLATAGGPWATTGRPPSSYFHVENVSNLIYEDPNGPPGTSPLCNLDGNVMVAGDHDNTDALPIEHIQAFESPTIDLAVRSSLNTTNSQGITDEMAKRPSILLQYDWYSGFMSLSESIFWQLGVRFHGPAMTSPVSGTRQWSSIVREPFVHMNPTPLCMTSVEDLSSLGEQPGKIDSLRVVVMTQSMGWCWGGTNLGNTRGTYFDNVSVGLYDAGQSVVNCPHLVTPRTEGGPGTGPPIELPFWAKLQDSFPFNETITPADNAFFDTTTTLVTSSLNIVSPPSELGVVAGDSMIVYAPYLGDGVTSGTRVDLVFRIDPGPGSFAVKGNRGSALVNRDPAHPFYAAYLANNGPFGTPGGHGGIWNRDVWNSCRIDSAELNYSPILSRGIGGPQSSNVWMATIHESDPNYGVLGIVHNLCFLVDPTGPDDQTNIVCDGTVPAPYGAVSGITKEGTKVLPDGWFTPGTHIEYYLRSSFIEDPTSYSERPDTREVYPHDFGALEDRDAERFAHVDVLPDMWKSTRYGGQGLACMLLVDAADRRGSNPSYRGGADSSGYGRTDGASKGWQRTGTAVADHGTPNNPADFVNGNLGQFGLSYDQFDIGGAEAIGSGRLGTRLAVNAGAIVNKKARQGPSQAMLETFYNTIVWASGDLAAGTMHDAVQPGMGSNDVALIRTFLADANAQNRSRALWLSGDGLAEDAASHSADEYALLTDDCGTDLTAPDYKVSSSTPTTSDVKFLPVAPWSQVGETYGFSQPAGVAADVLKVVSTVSNTSEAAQYENLGPSPWTASVWRQGESGRPYRTLVDGFDLSHLRTHLPLNSTNLSQTDVGRLIWEIRVLDLGLQTCLRKGPVVAIGDLPGENGAPPVSRLLAASPNPAPASQHVRFHFTLAAAQDIRVRVYTVAGREVASVAAHGKAGENSLEWDRRSSTGATFASGIYFYALEAGGVPVPADRRKLVLLGP